MLCKTLVLKTIIYRFCLFMMLAVSLNPVIALASPGISTLPYRPLVLPFHDSTKLAAPDAVATPAVSAIALNRNVVGYVDAFLKKEDEFLQKMKGRSTSFFRTIENVLDQHDVPVQLKYLAIVESELRNAATSRVGARGLWQLMPVTARELGLRITQKTDERTQTYRSTVAAAKYLRDLYTQFDDWLLVLAAYNSGPGTVMKAIKRAGSRNFWALQRFLPAESRGHVKRFISIHYFFEGDGSIATQTAAEAKAYTARLLALQTPATVFGTVESCEQ